MEGTSLPHNERKNFHYGSNDYVVLNIGRGLDFVYVEIGYLMKDYNQTLLFAAIVRIGEGNGTILVSRGWKDFFFLHHQQRKVIIQNSNNRNNLNYLIFLH